MDEIRGPQAGTDWWPSGGLLWRMGRALAARDGRRFAAKNRKITRNVPSLQFTWARNKLKKKGRMLGSADSTTAAICVGRQLTGVVRTRRPAVCASQSNVVGAGPKRARVPRIAMAARATAYSRADAAAAGAAAAFRACSAARLSLGSEAEQKPREPINTIHSEFVEKCYKCSVQRCQRHSLVCVFNEFASPAQLQSRAPSSFA